MADFNGDGSPDLVVGNFNKDVASVFLNKGDGTFAALADYGTDMAPSWVAAADFNRDGQPDLVLADQNSNNVSVLLNAGACPIVTAISPNVGSPAGGETITISGSRLAGATSVKIAGTAAAITGNTTTSISVTAPPHAIGTGDIVITTPGGKASLGCAYTYLPPPAAPVNLYAVQTSSTEAYVFWDPVPNATGYEVDRKEAGTGFLSKGSVTPNLFYDNTVQDGHAYLYRVRAVSPGGTSSNSNPILVTQVLYTNASSSLTGRGIEATDLAELRAALNAVRFLAGYSATFTDTGSVGSIIKAVHVEELRPQLAEARASLFLPVATYADPAPLAGVAIKSVHMTQLRTAAGAW